MKKRAFTLVELLVVIGIIALLVGILLPALSAARRQAAAVKCAASLREIGNAVQMYAMDNKGYAPPCKLAGSAGSYNLDGFNFQPGGSPVTPPYWTNFLAKYVTKTKLGTAANNASDAAQARKSVFWGCPAWDGYTAFATVGDTNITQFGYGMNGFPEFTASFPPKNFELGEGQGSQIYDDAVGVPTYDSTHAKWGGTPGDSVTSPYKRWYKLKAYSKPAERCLAGDCIFWFLEARPPLTPPQMAGQYKLINQSTWSTEDGAHETTFDWYRHGKYPPEKYADQYDSKGGKVAYNVLFADGHVATLTDQASSYRVIRMRYPF